MMLAHRVLITLDILVQYVSGSIDTYVAHRNGAHLHRSSALERNCIELRVTRESVVFYVRLNVCREINLSVSTHRERDLAASVSGQPARDSALDRHGPHVLRNLPVRGEYYILAVCRPERIAVHCRIGGQLDCRTATYRGDINVSLPGKCYLLSVRRNGTFPYPAGSCTGKRNGSCKNCSKANDGSVQFHIRFNIVSSHKYT